MRQKNALRTDRTKNKKVSETGKHCLPAEDPHPICGVEIWSCSAASGSGQRDLTDGAVNAKMSEYLPVK